MTNDTAFQLASPAFVLALESPARWGWTSLNWGSAGDAGHRPGPGRSADRAAVVERCADSRIDFVTYNQVRVEPTDAGFRARRSSPWPRS